MHVILAVAWTGDGILSIGPQKINFSEINRNLYIFRREKALENVFCEMAAMYLGNVDTTESLSQQHNSAETAITTNVNSCT